MPPVEVDRSAVAGVLAPPPLIYAVPLAAGLLLDHWFPLVIVARSIAVPIGVTAVLLGLIGLPAIIAFRRAATTPNPYRPTTALVTTGPFRWSRNPMYLGFTLLYLGVSFWVDTAWPLFALPVILAVMQYGVVVREEAYLEARFGDQYRAYRQRVRRWL